MSEEGLRWPERCFTGVGTGGRLPSRSVSRTSTRSIRLPEGVKEQEVAASYDNGVLTVKAPIGEVEKQRRRIEIDSGA
ncbi:Hsp20 family protein [Kitasatospora griseola]|uniref:Hsp20 family protein n=1 Tax=Kitasatospora griseola TaxID=2064 RepID=UPI0037F683AA